MHERDIDQHHRNKDSKYIKQQHGDEINEKIFSDVHVRKIGEFKQAVLRVFVEFVSKACADAVDKINGNTSDENEGHVADAVIAKGRGVNNFCKEKPHEDLKTGVEDSDNNI